MATASSIAARRADAEARIESAMRRISESTGVALPDSPFPVRSPDMRAAQRMEGIAQFLDALAEQVGGAPPAPIEPEKPDTLDVDAPVADVPEVPEIPPEEPEPDEQPDGEREGESSQAQPRKGTKAKRGRGK